GLGGGDQVRCLLQLQQVGPNPRREDDVTHAQTPPTCCARSLERLYAENDLLSLIFRYRILTETLMFGMRPSVPGAPSSNENGGTFVPPPRRLTPSGEAGCRPRPPEV